MKDDPNLLPAVREGSKTAEKLKENKDLIWNRQHLDSAILQGVLQGKSIPEISENLQQVTDMDDKAAVRNARTMMTGAQNAGRLDAYERADRMGIKIQKEWMATLDSRTRDSHQRLDGERVDWKKAFSNDLMYPGDPSGDPSEVYNCRCTMIPFYPEYADIIGDRVTYSEWVGQHKEPKEKTDFFDRSKVQYSSAGKYVKDFLDNSNVEYKEVALLKTQLSEEEIINRLAGGDQTKGSCFSLACAYAGNKNGLDVLDFRGGASQDSFARIFRGISRIDGVNAVIESKGGINPAKKLLKQMKEGKEYIFTTGRHTAITRTVNGEMQYLELQSATDSGWQPFERDWIFYEGTYREKTVHYNISDTLKWRFGCKNKTVSESSLIDIDSFKNSDEFRDFLGYINTDEDKQKKGKSGIIK